MVNLARKTLREETYGGMRDGKEVKGYKKYDKE